MRKSFKLFWNDVRWSIDDVFEKYFEILAAIGVCIFCIIFSIASFFAPLIAIKYNVTPWILASYLVLLPINIFLWLFMVRLREHI
jgi:hypothetical protein